MYGSPAKEECAVDTILLHCRLSRNFLLQLSYSGGFGFVSF